MMRPTKKKPPATVDAGLDPAFAPIAKAFEKDRDVSVGKMFGSAGLKVGGKVFAMVVKGRFVAKLPKSRVDELVGAGRGEHFDPGHGRLMKEWVSVPSGKTSWFAGAAFALDSVAVLFVFLETSMQKRGVASIPSAGIRGFTRAC